MAQKVLEISEAMDERIKEVCKNTGMSRKYIAEIALHYAMNLKFEETFGFEEVKRK